MTKEYWQNRHIHCTDADGNSFVVAGNFDIDKASVTIPLPSQGDWKEYNGTASWNNVSEVSLELAPAEYKILVNF